MRKYRYLFAPLKRFVPDKKKGAFLIPSNPDFAPIHITEDDECELIGKVIFKIIKCK
jgi:SOS-response transcriptional repressor LexA